MGKIEYLPKPERVEKARKKNRGSARIYSDKLFSDVRFNSGSLKDISNEIIRLTNIYQNLRRDVDAESIKTVICNEYRDKVMSELNTVEYILITIRRDLDK